MFMKTTFAVFAVLLFLLTVQALADTVSEAKKEGNLVFYGTMSSPDMVRVVKAFESKYPFVKVQTFRANSERVLNKILTEARAGSYFVDAINLDGINGWVLKEKDMLQPHKSAETEAYPEAFRDPSGLMPCCLYVVTNDNQRSHFAFIGTAPRSRRDSVSTSSMSFPNRIDSDLSTSK